MRPCVLAVLSLGLAACGASTTRVAGAGASAVPGMAVAPTTPASPCSELHGLMIEAAPPIAALWSGGTITGGEGTIRVRWCGEGDVVVDQLRLLEGERAVLVRALDPAHAHLGPGDALDVTVTGTAMPVTLEVEATARDASGAALVARGTVECVEDPALVAERDACVAAGGTFAPGGLAGALACDRPTSDAGRRCLSDADCEGPCLDDHTEVVATAPGGRACAAGEELRLHVGACASHTLLFGCAPRLLDVTSECARPGMVSRSSTVCVD